MTAPFRVSGPLFDGRAKRAAEDLCDAIEYTVAHQAHAELMRVMDGSFRNPTPYYEIQTTVQPRGEEMVVHDRGIVYGPWLVGVSSRNRTSKFKGYDMYRRATTAVIPQVARLVAHVLPQFLRRMG